MKKYVTIWVLIALGITMLGGCALGDKISSLREEFRQDGEGTAADANLEVPEVVILPDGTTTLDPAGQEGTHVAGETRTVLLYYTDEAGEYLIAEEREVAKVEGIARATMEALLDGPENVDLEPTIPAGTRLMDINIKEDGLAIVDFSSELADNLENSSKKEKMAVYSIVNTLTQFPTVERVEIRVAGKTVNTLKGKIKLDQDLFRDDTIIKKP
jgi:germination protein M